MVHGFGQHLVSKQWGFEETETKTIAFPISFESIKYVFLSKIYGPASGGADTVAYNFFRKSLTGVSFDYAYTRNWLAIGGKQPQWGVNIHGWVTFPITFVKFRRLVTNHQGNVFMDSKARESNTLSGFTLDVADNSDQNKDAQWIAIGA